MKKLTKVAEDKLLSALQDIAELTNEGTEPNEAIAKVASEKNIPHGHVQLLVNAYNTGRTTIQRKSNEDVWAKSAEFPLADTSIILSHMYPDKVKTAAEQRMETVVSSDYSRPPTWVAQQESREKQARAFDWKMTDKKLEPLPKEDNSYNEAKDQIKKAELEAEEARFRASYAFDHAVRLKNQLKDYFKQAGCLPFPDVRKNAVLLHGPTAARLFDQLVSEEPRFAKVAASRLPSPAKGQVYELVSQCLEMADAYSQLREMHQTKQAEAATLKEDLMRPFGSGPKLDPVLGVPVSASAKAPKAGSPSEKQGGLFSGLGSGFSTAREIYKGRLEVPKVTTRYPWSKAIAGMVLDPSKTKETMQKLKPEGSSAADTDYESVVEHNNTMNALHQESMLTDLLAGDEVLSHRNPHEVLEAYSALRQLAPQAAMNKEVVRSYLRDRLEKGQQGLFDIEPLLKVDRYISNRDRGMPQEGNQ